MFCDSSTKDYVVRDGLIIIRPGPPCVDASGVRGMSRPEKKCVDGFCPILLDLTCGQNTIGTERRVVGGAVQPGRWCGRGFQVVAVQRFS